MELGSYPQLELLLSQKIPGRSSGRLLYLLVFTSWDPPTEMALFSYPRVELLLSQEASARNSHRFLCLLVNTSRQGQLSPTRVVIVTRSSCKEQLQVFVSPRQYFLRLSPAMELGKYPPLEMFLSKEAPAWRSHRFLYFLVNTSWVLNRVVVE